MQGNRAIVYDTLGLLEKRKEDHNMVIQIKGNVKFNITLDPTTWIFDDRKVSLNDLQLSRTSHDEITFDDSKEWNRQILEGGTNPPTLKSEKKFKKQQLLEEDYCINMEVFFNNAELNDDAKEVLLTNVDDKQLTIPVESLKNLYFQFSKQGKRIHENGSVDAFVFESGEVNESLNQANQIEVK